MKETWLYRIKRRILRSDIDTIDPSSLVFEESEETEETKTEIIVTAMISVFETLSHAKKAFAFTDKTINGLHESLAKKDTEISSLNVELRKLETELKRTKNEVAELRKVNYEVVELRKVKNEVAELRKVNYGLAELNKIKNYGSNRLEIEYIKAQGEIADLRKQLSESRHNAERYEKLLLHKAKQSPSEMEQQIIIYQTRFVHLEDQRSLLRFKAKELQRYKERLMHSYLKTADPDSEWHKLKMKEMELFEKESTLIELEKKLRATDPNFLNIFTNSYKYKRRRSELIKLKKTVGKLNAYMQSEKVQEYSNRETELLQQRIRLEEKSQQLNKWTEDLKKLERQLRKEENKLYEQSVEKQRLIYEEIEKEGRMLFVVRSLHSMSKLYEASLLILLENIQNKRHRNIVACLLEGESVYEIAEKEGVTSDAVYRMVDYALKKLIKK